MFPFFYAPTFEYPLSGDVTQGIAPSLSVDLQGIPEVEHEVITSVASYGAQLGKLTEAVLLLAEKAGVEGDEIAAVRKIADGVEAAKARAAEAARERAERATARADKLDQMAVRAAG